MLEVLFTRFGTKDLYAFWDVVRITSVTEQELREMKLGYRAKILKRQTNPFEEGLINEHSIRVLSSEALRSALLTMYGVRSDSVGYLMFEMFKRYDAFDYISSWEQKINSRLLFDEELVDSSRILSEVKRRWGRWKILVSHYLFEELFWRHRRKPIPDQAITSRSRRKKSCDPFKSVWEYAHR